MRTTRHAEAQIEESIVSLFEDFPSLCGFAVQTRPQADPASEALRLGLYLTEVGFWPQPPAEDARVICEGVRDSLMALMDERPEARDVLSGRTFARALH